MNEMKNTTCRDADIPRVEGLQTVLDRFLKRIGVSNSGSSMGKTYRRSVPRIKYGAGCDLCLHTGVLPEELDLDEIMDYLNELTSKGMNLAKTKLDVAELRYYYREMLDNEPFSGKIYYPKKEKTLPAILCREELLRLFSCCKNPKYKGI